MTQRADGKLLWRTACSLARQTVLLPRVGPALREHAPSTHLTVFVHGYFSWPGVLRPLGDHLAASRVATKQLHFLYPPTGTVAEHAVRLSEAIRQHHGEGPVNVIGYSLGGLIGRFYKQILGGRVDRIVCLASPHRGTDAVHRWRALPLAREIVPGSETLRVLDATASRLQGTRLCSIVAERDALVTPVDSAELDGHEVVRIPDVGHQALLYDRTAWSHVARVLASPVPTPTPARRGRPEASAPATSGV